MSQQFRHILHIRSVHRNAAAIPLEALIYSAYWDNKMITQLSLLEPSVTGAALARMGHLHAGDLPSRPLG